MTSLIASSHSLEIIVVTSFFCVLYAIQRLQDRIVEIELPSRIPFLLQSSQSLYPPALVPIQLLQRFVSIGIIDIGVELPCLFTLEL